MKTSENINELAKALAAAQGEIKNAIFNRVNPHFKSRYADLAEIRNSVIPIMAKNGIAVVQGTHGSVGDGYVAVYTRLIHHSGQWIESVYPILNEIGKPQLMGSAFTYARRYSLAAMAGIAAEEDDANAAQEHGEINGNDHDKPTYSKARSREPFAKLDTALRNHSSLDDLSIWWDESKADRDRLDRSFHTELAFNYIMHGLAIAESLIALKAFYGDCYKHVMPGMPLDKQEAIAAAKENAKTSLSKIETVGAG